MTSRLGTEDFGHWNIGADLNVVNLLAAALAVFIAVSPVPAALPQRFARALRDVTLAVGIGAALAGILLYNLAATEVAVACQNENKYAKVT